jgi:hypothetical protein
MLSMSRVVPSPTAIPIRWQPRSTRPGAKGLGYYVEADGVQTPQPGDIIVLRNGVGKGVAASVGHVGILVEAGATEWRTADEDGTLPDQRASVTTRTVRFENSILILKSPTDLEEKQPDSGLTSTSSNRPDKTELWATASPLRSPGVE